MLGETYLSSSVPDEYAVWFLATELVLGERLPESTERLSVRCVPLREALSMALEGEISDALSPLAIMSYALECPHPCTMSNGSQWRRNVQRCRQPSTTVKPIMLIAPVEGCTVQ
jgi:hypothetical protein